MSGERSARIAGVIREHLKPHVKRVDAEAYYAGDYLRALGASGLLQSEGLSEADVRLHGVELVEETAAACMTTAFNLWCHLAAMTYVRHSGNAWLKERILPGLESGRLLGGTGLSNPMKFYAGIDKLILQAAPCADGYVIRGRLPMVSNLGNDHWFGIVAETDDGRRRIMAFVPCEAERLKRVERLGYLGLNGSATYACEFDGVLVRRDWVISEEADAFVERIRPTFVLYQIPLGLGVTDSSIRSIRKVRDLYNGCNRFLPDQPETLSAEWAELRSAVYRLAGLPDLAGRWHDLVRLRLRSVFLTLKAVQAGMLHHGSAGYVRDSSPSRRLREAYFFANLTPTVKHLEKLLSGLPATAE
jgi:hypothetical protein